MRVAFLLFSSLFIFACDAREPDAWLQWSEACQFVRSLPSTPVDEVPLLQTIATGTRAEALEALRRGAVALRDRGGDRGGRGARGVDLGAEVDLGAPGRRDVRVPARLGRRDGARRAVPGRLSQAAVAGLRPHDGLRLDRDLPLVRAPGQPGHRAVRRLAGGIDRIRLKPVYQNLIVGALRVRAWNGSGVSWLPDSLIAADIQTGGLCRAGANQWNIDLTINLIRLNRKQDSQLDHIWQHVKTNASTKQ